MSIFVEETFNHGQTMSISLTPHHTLLFSSTSADWRKSFLQLALGQEYLGDISEHYWKTIATAFLTELCLGINIAEKTYLPPRNESQETKSRWVAMCPPMQGAEYLKEEVFDDIWRAVNEWCAQELTGPGQITFFWNSLPAVWRQIGKVHFHLAENRKNEHRPFAFMATYTEGIGVDGRSVHMSLLQVLMKYQGKNAGKKDTSALRRILTPLQKAEEAFPWVQGLVESGKILSPLAFSPRQAKEVLDSAEDLEECGIRVRLPDWWRNQPRPTVNVVIGKQKGGLGLEGLMDFSAELALGDETISPAEIEWLLHSGEGLIVFRGHWVDLDKEKLEQVLAIWKLTNEGRANGAISIAEALRLLSGMPEKEDTAFIDESVSAWVKVQAGEYLSHLLEQLRNPEAMDAPANLHADLRPYQKRGLAWMWTLSELGLGACLADDMGLGKTVQVLAYLLKDRNARPQSAPALLVLPASLIGNWLAEIDRFAPDLKIALIHPSQSSSASIRTLVQSSFAGFDLAITTYGWLTRNIEEMSKIQWSRLILDEAQAIKNAGTKQTKAVNRLSAITRIAMTGTPIENSLADLWSLFNCINRGLLGTAKTFKESVTKMEESKHRFAPLRKLLSPYILRRLKTDKNIISDLPDKTESVVYCRLTKEQVKLYGEAVNDLEEQMNHFEDTQNIARRGAVLQSIMRLKQICNHPSQYTGLGRYEPKASGKFQRLGELCSEFAARQEKVLVFTQYQEIIRPLASFLEEIFGRAGLVLHGAVPVAKRAKLVENFQREDGAPFFLLSLKAGGTGLTLTAATHVVHFDRWWNPAVEDQATDRAFRIGQKKAVFVHPFVVRGTLEERIDELLQSKREQANEILSTDKEMDITSLSNEELLNLVRLDLKQTAIEGD